MQDRLTGFDAFRDPIFDDYVTRFNTLAEANRNIGVSPLPSQPSHIPIGGSDEEQMLPEY
ncbi:MAG: hypothetical protein FWE05_13320 [Defluviitaleaceae bacterium]|nr:hypothetical protein [Defluviitaleaceae bacterium]